MSDIDISPRAVTIAAVQFEPVVGESVRNRANIGRLVAQAKSAGADLVILPELADSGYNFANRAELAYLAGPVPNGPSSELIQNLAAEHSLYIASGIAETTGEHFYNTAMLCGPDGYIGKYRKLHLWNREHEFFAKGDLGLPVFDLPFGRIGLAICYDGWFPETFRALALAGAELVCVPTNWVPGPGQHTAETPLANILHSAAAHSNGMYIACADRIGVERDQPFIGKSIIIGPQGLTLAGPASCDREEILYATIDLSSVEKSRSLNRFNHLLEDRRADVYGSGNLQLKSEGE